MLIGKIKTVTVIGQESCINCKKLKRWLEDKKIPYFYIDFDTLSLDMQKEIASVRRESGLKQIGLPLFIYGEELYMSYDLKELGILFG